MPGCVAYKCSSNTSKKIPGITFHRFPTKVQLRNEWVNAVKRAGFQPSNASRLCSKHFSEDQFDRSSCFRVRLHKDAIPNVFDFPKHMQKPMPNNCCVPSCRGNYAKGPHVSAFKFPRDKVLAEKWLQIINRKDFHPSKSSRICELHFEEDAILRETSMVDPSNGRVVSAKLFNPRLKKDAIPTKIPVRSSSQGCTVVQSEQKHEVPTKKTDGPPYVSYCKIDKTNPSEIKDTSPTKLPSRSSDLPNCEIHRTSPSEKKGKVPTKIKSPNCSIRKTRKACQPKRKGAVSRKTPSILPCLSNGKTCTAHASKNKDVIANNPISVAFTNSIKLEKTTDENDFYFSLDEGVEKIQTSLNYKWRIFKNDSSVTIAMLVCNPAPTIICSVVLSRDLELTAFCSSREMKEVGNYNLPMLCNSVKVICDILNCLEKQPYETPKNETSGNLKTYFFMVQKH